MLAVATAVVACPTTLGMMAQSHVAPLLVEHPSLLASCCRSTVLVAGIMRGTVLVTIQAGLEKSIYQSFPITIGWSQNFGT